jgi:hypothetical protein
MQIPVNEFEEYIEEKILRRGLSYFKNGNVNDVEEITPGVYEAVVNGSEDYLVNLTIEKGKIIEYDCSCPYDMGPVCKHIAAVIFHLQEDKLNLTNEHFDTKSTGKNKSSKRKTVTEQVNELLKEISHEDLMQFIREKAEENPSFRNLFLISFANRNPQEESSLYIKQIKSILRTASGRNGFIDYSESHIVGNAISKLLISAQNHLESKNYRSAFLICTAVMEQLTEALQYSDDSDGSIGGNIEYACEILFDIANEELTEEMRKLIFEYCITAFDKRIYSEWDWNMSMLHLASILLKTKEEGDLILFHIDKGEKYLHSGDELQSIQYDILKKIKGDAAADSYLEANISNPRLRRKAISNAIEDKSYDKAGKLALDGIKHDKKDKPGLVIKWYDWLLKISQAQNNIEKIIEYARLLFIDGFSGEQDYYKILKQNVPHEKWNMFVEEIIKAMPAKNRWYNFDAIAKIYIEEKWWDRLLKLVKGSPELHTIEHYEEFLKKDYSDELILLYSKAITGCLENNADRGHYRTACRYLKKIIKLGGIHTAIEIKEELKRKYPKRKALIEELNKV